MVGALASAPAGTQFTVGNAVRAVVVLASAFVFGKSVELLFSKAADRFVRHRFRVMVVIPVVKFVIYGGAVYVALASLFVLTRTQLIAFAGLLGAALGLGFKDLLADVVGGLVLVIERPFQVGDKVSIGGHYGEITDIGVRSTRLLTSTGTLAVVPNFTVFNDAILNANTSDAEMMVAVEFTVDPEADVRRATEIVEEALITSPYVYVSEDAPYAVEVEDRLHYRALRGKAYVTELRKEVAFKTDVTVRVLETFDREGIRSPTVAGDGE